MATGNIKISDLTSIKSVNGKEVFPVSAYDDKTATYSSYKMTVNDVASHVDTTLGVSENADKFSYLTRDLGQCTTYISGSSSGQYVNGYVLELELEVADNSAGAAFIYANNVKSNEPNSISVAEKSSVAGFSISKRIHVPKGYMCLIEFPKNEYTNNNSKLKDISIFTKISSSSTAGVFLPATQQISTPNYNTTVDTIIGGGTSAKRTIYEAMPHNYFTDNITGDSKYLSKLPSSDMMGFLATEDCDILISAPTNLITNKRVYMVYYSVFADMTDKFIGRNTDTSKVISEAIASLDARISSLEENAGTIGTTVAEQIDNINMPKYRGGDMIIISNSEPILGSTAGVTPNVVPSFPGQLWINTKAKKVMIAIGTSSKSDWITVTTA